MFGWIKKGADGASLWYQGDSPSELRYCINFNDVGPFFENQKQAANSGLITIEEQEVKLLGQPYNLKIPTIVCHEADAEGADIVPEMRENCTEEVIAYLYDQMLEKVIKEDVVLIKWKRFLNTHKIYKHNKDGTYAFHKDTTAGYQAEWRLPAPELYYYKQLINHRFIDPNDPRCVFDDNDELQVLDIARNYTFENTRRGTVTIPGLYSDTMDEMFSKDTSIYRKMGKALKDFQQHASFNFGHVSLMVAARQVGKTFTAIREIRNELFKYRFYKNDQCKVGLLAKVYKINVKILKDMDVLMQPWKKYGMWKADTSLTGSQSAEVFKYSHDAADRKDKETWSSIFGMSEKSEGGFDGQQADLIVGDEAEKLHEGGYLKMKPMIMRDSHKRLLLTSTLKETGEITWFGDEVVEMEKKCLEDAKQEITMEEAVAHVVEKYQLYKYKTIPDILQNCDLYQAKGDLYDMIRQYAYRYPSWVDESRSYDDILYEFEEMYRRNPAAALAEMECVFTRARKPLRRSKIESELTPADIMVGRGLKKFNLIVYTFDLTGKGTDDRKLQMRVYDSDFKSETYNKVIGFKSKAIVGRPEEQARDVMKYILEWNEKFHVLGGKTKQYVFGYDVNGVGQNMDGYFTQAGLSVGFKLHPVKGTKVWYRRREQNDPHVVYTSKQIAFKDVIEFINNDNVITTMEMEELRDQCDTFHAITTERGEVIYNAQRGNDQYGNKAQDGEISCMMMALAFFMYEYKIHNIISSGRGAELEKLIKKMGEEEYKRLMVGHTGDPLEAYYMNNDADQLAQQQLEKEEEDLAEGDLIRHFGY